MSALQFIDSLAGHLAWPAVVLLLGLVLRRPIAGVLRRLTSLRWGDKEAVLAGMAGTADAVQEAVELAASPMAEEGNRRRLLIEQLMREAASWGFRLRAGGIQVMPALQIKWIDGQPMILAGQTNDLGDTVWTALIDQRYGRTRG